MLKRLLFVFFLLAPQMVHAEVKVVATLPALGQIAAAVVGDAGDVKVLARVGQDPHFVPPKPTLARHLSNADLLLTAGLALESGWLPPLVEVSRNSNVRPGQQGYFEGASAVQVIGAQAGADRSMGDVHPEGNPHWWLDPLRAGASAKALAERLAAIDPAHGDAYNARAAAFAERLQALVTQWQPRFARARAVISYHDSYRYFVERFGIPVVGFIEPKPGVEPSPRHLDRLVQIIESSGVKQLWVEPYHQGRVVKRIASLSNAAVVVMPDAADGEGSDGYVALIESLLNSAFEGQR